MPTSNLFMKQSADPLPTAVMIAIRRTNVTFLCSITAKIGVSCGISFAPPKCYKLDLQRMQFFAINNVSILKQLSKLSVDFLNSSICFLIIYWFIIKANMRKIVGWGKERISSMSEHVKLATDVSMHLMLGTQSKKF